MWLMKLEKEKGQYGYVMANLECVRRGVCGRGHRCYDLGRKECILRKKSVTKWLVIGGGEIRLIDREEGEESDEGVEVPWSVYGDDSD